MKEPKKKNRVRQVVIAFPGINGRRVIDVMEAITAANVRGLDDLTFSNDGYGRIEVVVDRPETDAEFGERLRKYQQYIDLLRVKEEKAKEKELKRKLGDVARLQAEINKLKGINADVVKTKLEKTLESKSSRLQDVS